MSTTRADDVVAVADVDRLRLGNAGDVRVVQVAVAGARELRSRRVEDLDRRTVVERERAVGAGLGKPQVDQLADLVRVLAARSCTSARSTSTLYSSQVSSLKWLQPLIVGWVLTAFQPSCQIPLEPSIE